MSSLLEQAIVDAKALKEAALKNAEQLILEKYSNEVKTAIDSLLEQEEAAPADGALVGNHVITSNTDDARSPRLLNYGSDNLTFFVAPEDGSGRTGRA